MLEVAEGREQIDAEMLLEELPATQRAKIQAAAIDMSAACSAAVRAKLPAVEIVHLHIACGRDDGGFAHGVE